jgi:hypothetical protein
MGAGDRGSRRLGRSLCGTRRGGNIVPMRDYEYVESLGCHGVFRNDTFERMVESRREVWFGDDGSGLIRTQLIRSHFFTDAQRLSWETTAHPTVTGSVGPSLDLFAAGCFHGPRRRLAQLATSREALAEQLESRRQLNLHGIGQLIGEALVPEEMKRAFFDLAADLPEAQIVDDATDQLGRRGVGIIRVEHRWREELIFGSESLELLGYRQVLNEPNAGYALAGAIVGWTSYVCRELVDALPAGTPPVPEPPCYPPGAGRGTVIRPGLMLGTGYFTDLQPHLDQWLAAGVITQAEHQNLSPAD